MGTRTLRVHPLVPWFCLKCLEKYKNLNNFLRFAPWFLMTFLHSFPGVLCWGSCWTLQQFHLPGAPMVRSGQSKPKLLQSYGILVGDLLGMFIVHLLKKKIPVRKGGSITPYESWRDLMATAHCLANRTSQSWSLGNLDKSATLDSGPHVPASRSCEKVSPKPPWPECGGVTPSSWAIYELNL